MILVTGATGNTGRAVVEGLVSRGVAVRAMVRRPEQAETFPPGVQVVLADMERVETLALAVAGVQQMLLISSLEPKLPALQEKMVRAAQRGGVRRIVKISTEIADPASNALIGRWHGRFVHVPMALATRNRKRVDTTADLWMSVIEATGQPRAFV